MGESGTGRYRERESKKRREGSRQIKRGGNRGRK